MAQVRRRHRLFDSSSASSIYASPFFASSPSYASTPRPRHKKTALDVVLPAAVLVVLVAGAAFAVFSLSRYLNATDVRFANNGKYESIRFGFERRRQRLLEEGRVDAEELALAANGIDPDTGEELGNGKRASIRYAHLVLNKDEKDSNIRVVDDSAALDEKSAQDEEELKRLRLKKLSEFGHFTTTSLNAEIKSETKTPTPEPKASKKKPRMSKAPREPFTRADDPFRFIPEI